MYQVKKNKNLEIEAAINNLKPPLFWKDKPRFIIQAKKWNKERLRKLLERTYNIEKLMKTNSSINKQIILKELIVNICNSANA